MTGNPFHNRRISTNEAADILGVKPRTLNKWRCIGRHDDLPYYKIGGRVSYLRGEVEAFRDSRRMLHTSLPAPRRPVCRCGATTDNAAKSSGRRSS
jgi:hypothetical protein